MYGIEMFLEINPDIISTTDLKGISQIVTRATDLDELAKNFFARISRIFEMFTWVNSGLVINKINYIQLSIHDFKLTTGASYKPLPAKIGATKSCINVKNTDNKCAMWALLSALFPASDHIDRVSNYKPYQCRINMNGINYPVPIKQIPKIEQQNPTLFRSGINVFSLDEQLRVFPYLISPASKHVTDNSAINLLWYNDHYVWIKNLSALMKSTMSGYKSKVYFCYSCLCGFTTQQGLIEHNKYCFEVKAVTTPSSPNNIYRFNKYERTQKLPFVFIEDFESFIQPFIDSKCVCEYLTGSSTQPSNCKTLSTQNHVSASYRINIICVEGMFSKLSPLYRISDVNDTPLEVHMLKYLFEEQTRIESLLSFEEMRFKKLESYQKSTICYRCKKAFTDKNPSVPFFDVISKRYIGAVHSRCRQFQKFYQVVFHNLRGYDGHFILRALGHPEIVEYCTDNKVTLKCIPNNTERLMSITVGKLRFIDSIQFMNTSLEQLAKNCNNFPFIEKYFDQSALKYITVKGIFPYEYFNGPARFSETSLPDQSEFYSSLTNSGITDEEYLRATTTWNLFQCKYFGDYHDLYLTVGVLLLSDIFENFRITSMNNYGLDPAHYYSAPGLSWDALLKSTRIQLELLTDEDMCLFIEKAIRGGISVITKSMLARTINTSLITMPTNLAFTSYISI